MLSENSQNMIEPTKIPFKVQFHFTDICNLRCLHCYDSAAKNDDDPFDQLCRIVDRVFPVIIEEWGRPVALSLTGGEPFASRNLFPLLSYIQEKYSEKDVFVHILSNGTLITESHAKALKSSYPIVHGVMASLDGVHQDTHERIRGKGTHRKVLHGWEVLVRNGISASTHMVVSTVNYHEAFELTEFTKNFGLSGLAVTRLVPIGRGQSLRKLEITSEQMHQLYTKLNHEADLLESSSESLRIERSRCDWPVLYTPPKYRVKDLYYPFIKNGWSCAVGRHAITINSDGTTFACARLPIQLGNILKIDFRDIWNHPILWKIRLRHRYTKGKCEKCEFMKDINLRFSCNGGALCVTSGHYGDIFQPDPGCSYNPGVTT